MSFVLHSRKSLIRLCVTRLHSIYEVLTSNYLYDSLSFFGQIEKDAQIVFRDADCSAEFEN